MATVQGVASMPLVELPNGYQVVFEAISPTTGLAVNGVTVTTITLSVDSVVPVPDLEVRPFVPIFTYGVPSNGESPGLSRGS